MKDHMDFLVEDIIEKIREMENPYPPDVFTHDNPELMNITRGRFNRHVYEVVENMRNAIIEMIKEEYLEDP